MNYRKYDELRIGQVLPEDPAIFHVDQECVEGFRDIHRTAIVEDAVSESTVAPPMLAAVYIRPAQNALKAPPGGIHAKQAFQFFSHVNVGDVLSTRLEILEKYERKGRRYLVTETRTKNQHDLLVAVGRITSIWGKEDA